jgi:hypothetical protein
MMSGPEIGVYACDVVRPDRIDNYPDIRTAGFTILIVSLFHIADWDRFKPIADGGALYFNGSQYVNQGKIQDPFKNWNDSLSRLKSEAGISKIYLSFGGGSDPSDPNHVRDFETIEKIYKTNSGTLHNTPLAENIYALRYALECVDGIDMDCEDHYDPDSFDAFCNLVNYCGFSEVTFAPFANPGFWVGAYSKTLGWGPGVVSRFNLQLYGDAAQFKEAFKPLGGPPKDFILSGDLARVWNPKTNAWFGNCPPDFISNLQRRRGEIDNVAGGFFWNLDSVYSFDPAGTHACPKENPTKNPTAAEYVYAIRQGMQ